MCGRAGQSRLIVCAGGDSTGLGRAGGSGVGWHLCSGCAEGVADGLPFYARRWTLGVASRMLVIMNGHNQTGGSNAFLRVFSCAGMVAAMMRGRAGSRSRGRGGGEDEPIEMDDCAHGSRCWCLWAQGRVRCGVARGGVVGGMFIGDLI